jgi:hypothetical protein
MTKQWDEAALQQHIDAEIEESLTLDYKAAGSIDKAEGKKKEITKDVSAMANSAGGTIIYGIGEYSDPNKKHLPEKITPIDRTQFPKEWLEQVINNIQPRIHNFVIYPVNLASGGNDVAYVVEIPQGNTAHQALDFRYYRRFNFQSVPMEDYEIRDIMNRLSTPDAAVEFKYKKIEGGPTNKYRLQVFVENLGVQVINNFQLEFTFPHVVGSTGTLIDYKGNIDLGLSETGDHLITYRSKSVLFPKEKREIGQEIVWDFEVDTEKYEKMRILELKGEESTVNWTLYADNMEPQNRKVLFKTLFRF